MKFIKYLFVFIAFVILKLISVLFRGTRKTIDVGVDAYKSVKNSESFDEAYRNFSSNKYAKARLSLPEEVIALMAKIAASDGKISELEIEYMSDTIKSMTHAMTSAGVNPVLVNQIKKRLFGLANRAKRDDNPVTYYCYALSRSNIEVKTGALLQIISFASLDGLSANTRTMLHEIGTHLGFSESRVDDLIQQVMGGAKGRVYQQNPYQVLGCNEQDDFAQIKKVYRKLVKQYHPDFMHGQGLDDQEIKQATEKMQEINAAYEEIKRRRGEV
ncbi:DnaJ domain-containing protein [Thiomicrospira microaerophila]|uniref:DnaJ domain-containing protein n=1 Tax=Thiomicrospira microaerophila TaxID=406020 RepID=UPI00200F3B11|nr:DnaJ domain-containing protein [Thiomicrospira microaerophila]UQB43168.1 DnaJ domain-containing protein [Thiomicrospira microaerophila]